MTAIDRVPTRATSPDARAGSLARVLITLGTILATIAVAVLPLLTPLFIHPALDAAASAERLGLAAAETHRLSDRSVLELVVGPGTFELRTTDGSAFYDESERSHLRDARLVLWLFLGLGIASAIAIGVGLARSARDARPALWQAIARGGALSAVSVLVLGLVSLVAFGTLFTLFHQVFFPTGNWAFDPSIQRLVQLYPFRFWQIAAAGLGVSVAIIGTLTWLTARSIARRAGAIDER